MENSVYEDKHILLNETILFFPPSSEWIQWMNVLLKLVYMSVVCVVSVV